MKISDAIGLFNQWRGQKVKSHTVDQYHGTLRQFGIFMHDCPVENIRIQDVIEWYGLMEKFGYQNNTFIPRSMAIKKFFEFLSLNGHDVLNAELVPIRRKVYEQPKAVTKEQYEALMGSIPAKTNDPRKIRNRALISMYWDTGARNSELLALEVDDLDLINACSIVNTKKSRGKRPFRKIYWSEQTNDYLIEWLAVRQRLFEKHWKHVEATRAVFVGCSGSNVGERLSVRGVGEMLRRLSYKAGLKDPVNAHSFRHGKFHRMVAQGATGPEVMNVAGHASLASSSVYTMLNDKELDRVADKYMEC